MSAERNVMSAQQLFVQYQPIAKQIALGFARRLPRTVLPEDVEAAAMVGLWDAVTRSAEHDGFEWYVRTRVRGAIIDELRRQDWLPRRARKRNPELGVCSLDAFESTDAISSLSVQPDAEQAIERKERAAILSERLARLPEREAAIMGDVLEGLPHWQIAQAMGISEPRISQLRTRAEQRLLGIHPAPQRPRRRAATVAAEPRKTRPIWEALPLRSAAVLKHWLLCGRPLDTARHFAMSRSNVMEIVDVSLKALGHDGKPGQVPVAFAIAAYAQERGVDQSTVRASDAWPRHLSAAENETVLGLLKGETREAMAARRGSRYRTISNQLHAAFRKLGVSTVGELRALCARVHVDGSAPQMRAA